MKFRPTFFVLFYCFHNHYHHNHQYKKHSYDCQKPNNPRFSTSICYFLVKSIIIGRIYQPFTKSNIPRKGNTEKIYEIILKSTILYDCKQDYRNISHSPEIFYRLHTFHSVLYFFFRFTDFQLSTFLFVTGFGFYLLHLFLCFFLFLLCFIYRFNR